MSASGQRYNVGGVMLDRPFKIRRLGHFGFNVDRMEECREFYGDLLGFTQSDKADFSRAPWYPKDLGHGADGYFMRYGTDHHAMVLFSKQVMDHRSDRKFEPGVTINQITWQCGSLREIVDAHGYFEEHQVRIQRVGRDMPGSNWHTYVYDPDGHTTELYYGIEQIGWNQRSKPRDMYYRGFGQKPDLPQMSEAAELDEAGGKGIDVYSGHLPKRGLTESFDVDGVLLPRPFKITKIGPVRLFVNDVDKATAFYTRHLGFTVSEETAYRGARCVFLRCGAEHHSVALYPRELRATLGLSEHTSCLSFGIEVANYATAGSGRFSQIAWRAVCRLGPARALSRYRLLRFRARPGRPLHPALLLHRANRLGRAGAEAERTPPSVGRVARRARTPIRHLCRSGISGPIRLRRKPWTALNSKRA